MQSLCKLKLCMQRAVKENREMREKQATLERKKEEREQATKKRGSFKFFSRSSKSFEEDTKKELEAKVRAKKIDIKALEESRKEKSRQSSEKQQKDFRHVLRHTDHSKVAKKSPERKTTKGMNEVDTGHSTRQPPRPDGENKKGRHIFSSEATELTGSWDYIPSEPSSTVDLLANAQEQETEREQINSRGRVPSRRHMEYAVGQFAQQLPPRKHRRHSSRQHGQSSRVHQDERQGPNSEINGFADGPGHPRVQQGQVTTEYSGRSRQQQGPPSPQEHGIQGGYSREQQISSGHSSHSRQQQSTLSSPEHGVQGGYSREQQTYRQQQGTPSSPEQDIHGGYSKEQRTSRQQQSPPSSSQYYDRHSRDSSDDMASSSPILDLPNDIRIGTEERWDGSGQSWNLPSQDLDYETQF